MNTSIVGTVMDMKRFAVHDGPGIRTTFFLKGCSLRCIWCHNPEGISPKGQLAYYPHKCIQCGMCVKTCPAGAHLIGAEGHVFDRKRCLGCGACETVCLGNALKFYGREISAEKVIEIALEDRVFYEESGGGVTLSGGEPLLQADFCAAVAAGLKQHGVGTAIDTCGCVEWEAFERLLPVAEMFLFDLKHISPQAHKQLTGQENHRIIQNLTRLSGCGARIEIRIPLVPGCNDDPETIDGMGQLLGGLNIEKVRVLPYHSLARSKYASLGMRDTMPKVDSPDDAQIAWVVERLRGHGVTAVSGRA